VGIQNQERPLQQRRTNKGRKETAIVWKKGGRHPEKTLETRSLKRPLLSLELGGGERRGEGVENRRVKGQSGSQKTRTRSERGKERKKRGQILTRQGRQTKHRYPGKKPGGLVHIFESQRI